MKSNFEPFFKRYEIIAKQVDELIEKVKRSFPGLVSCKLGCSDCCHALFDLTFVEALYLNDRFNEVMNKRKKNEIKEISNEVDRKIHRIKRKAQNFIKNGEKSSEQVLYEMSTHKMRCPLLGSDDLCEMYAFRPITCRVYGVPVSFVGQSHTCGLSGFETGTSYLTINLDNVHKKLYSLSADLAKGLKSRHIGIGEMLMPVSMVLLTEFNNEYLGLKSRERTV